MAVLGRKSCAFACCELIVSLKTLLPTPFLLKTHIANLYSLLSSLSSAWALWAPQWHPWGFCIHPNIWHVCESLLKLMGVMCDWEQLAGWIAESWNNYGRNSQVFVFLQMILYCVVFTSALGRTAEKLSYSWCHLVTFEAYFWCFIILCLFFTCDLICSLIENTVTFPLLSSFVSLLKVIFFKCSRGWLGDKVQLLPRAEKAAGVPLRFSAPTKQVRLRPCSCFILARQLSQSLLWVGNDSIQRQAKHLNGC